MFGDGSTAEERAARRDQDRSILDSLTGSLSRLRTNISAADKARLDEYAQDVREIERRLQIAKKAAVDAPSESTVPVGVPESFDEHIKLQFDLMALAFRGDITRVGTLLYARDLTSRNYPDSGTLTSFHGGSHHGEDPKRIKDYSVMNQYHVKMLAHFVEKLAKTPDGDGTLLDHSLILYGTNMGNSNQHLHHDVPHVLAGGGSGALKGGRQRRGIDVGLDRKIRQSSVFRVRRRLGRGQVHLRIDGGTLAAAATRAHDLGAGGAGARRGRVAGSAVGHDDPRLPEGGPERLDCRPDPLLFVSRRDHRHSRLRRFRSGSHGGYCAARQRRSRPTFDPGGKLTNIEAHITGTVWKIEVAPGDNVDEGDTVVILESMKMEMPVEAEDAGVVKEIACEEGQAVSEGDTLVVLE